MNAAGYRTCRSVVEWLVGLALAWAVAGIATAQGTTSATTGAAPTTVAVTANFDTLRGTWIRPDGGYRIVVRNTAENGQIEATYFNPTELPFAQAQASRQNAQLRVFFELRAGGYNGSTYDLVYDPASDRLKGVYYQAVVKQSFDVYFVRK
jgi:hypothetical protein